MSAARSTHGPRYHGGNTPLARAVATVTPSEVFKDDGRTKVWRVELPDALGGVSVVKRFEFSPLRQLLALPLGLHPGWREIRMNDKLRRRELPVAPVTAWGLTWQGLGCRLWMVSPWRGRSLLHRLRDREYPTPSQRRVLADAVGGLTAAFITAGRFNRDHKTSNILIDDDTHAWLVDVGGVRETWLRSHAWRMLATLSATTPPRLASRADRLRVLKRVVALCPSLGSLKDAAGEVAKSMLK